ncbi:MAG TPA: gluconokinase, partial [Cyclobacteriaceae bacterium]|nr:gluconokinase [Cyclobacteriaceae bacterium]
MPYILGVDIGTGSTKAVAISEQADSVLLTEQVSYPTFQPMPHCSEQSPELIWQAFVKCIRQVISKLKEEPKAIGLSSAMHSIIPVDQNGIALMNMITWADGRSADIAKRIRSSPPAKTLYEATGTPIHAMSPLCKLVWLNENQRDIFTKAHKFISIKEYIWFKLFHVFEVDHSMASGEGLMDVNNLNWYEPALKIAGISTDQLSALVSTSHHRWELSDEAKQLLPTLSAPFVVGAGDGVLANLGSNAITTGVAALTIGTSGAIRVARDKPCYNFDCMTFNYRLDEKTIICGGPVNNGG